MTQFPTGYVRPTGIKLSYMCILRIGVPYPDAQLGSFLFGRNGAQTIPVSRTLYSNVWQCWLNQEKES